jgi:hypothetical protein
MLLKSDDGLARQPVLHFLQVPSNGLILPSVSTAKCGDVIRFRCPPQAKHGVYKMSFLNCKRSRAVISPPSCIHIGQAHHCWLAHGASLLVSAVVIKTISEATAMSG